MRKVLIFPAAFMANTFSMMLIMIGLSLFGRSELAADFGIVHGATVALFYSFSGNARSLILCADARVSPDYVLRLRCILLFPLCAIAFILSMGLVVSGLLFVALLIIRRGCEWLAEVFLCDQEYKRQPLSAFWFFLTQAILSFALLLTLSFYDRFGFWLLAIWAISPLCCCLQFKMFAVALKKPQVGENKLKLLLPHFGSTAVIGVSVYVFRLFMVLLAGRQVAGDLFSAFAMGGILGALFTQALGPTLAHHEKSSPRSMHLLHPINVLVAGSFCFGALILIVVALSPGWLLWTGKAELFWLAVGCSLIGGAVTVKAQRVRLKLIQHGKSQDVFGSDMLANILLVGCIPFVFYGLGISYLSALYLFGSLLSLVFYSSEKNGIFPARKKLISDTRLLQVFAFVLFFPMFFQLSKGVYQSADAGAVGRLETLPVPISVLVCYAGIVILGQYSKVRVSLITVFSVFICMLSSILVLSTDYGLHEQSRLILLIQYVLPIFALVLGQQYGLKKHAIFEMAKALFLLLWLVVPLQVVLTIIQGDDYLTPSLYVFGIYQHLQYVVLMFVGAFLISFFTLWDVPAYRVGLLSLMALVAGYVSLSHSLLACFLLVTGLLGFVVRNLMLEKLSLQSCKVAATIFILLCAGIFLHSGMLLLKEEVSPSIMFSLGESGEVGYWRFYLVGIFHDLNSFAFGHLNAPDRVDYPVAYNYYLEAFYNFGFIGVLPLFVLILFTLKLFVGKSCQVFWSSGLLSLFGVLLFLLLVDNALTVGMRQPYSGIITFFLWGVAISSCIKLTQTEEE
ncbi:hypothetical protein HX867_03810 [Pseudomonas gingeri]|uniref:hypothetical protein n=1 Tax=Pseudomonas gingeri TaxID=117681 RepID=UPI0015A2FF65|nr:hypothetical protein [Pseudomonas gingeri]NVZ61199.1 hypothetical protein [Pseudomonas gingeri]NVZ73752.1 hypothetical protein [Pseudomonas gingeri]